MSEEYYEEGEIASWSDVFYYCYYHFKEDFISVFVHFTIYLAFSCLFFGGIVLLGVSLQVMGGCDSTALIASAGNPLSCMMAGMLVSSLFQSSFVVNNVLIAALVANGMSVEHGIFMAMGTGLGSSVTSSLLSLFHINDKNMLERAVAGASVNTIYYICAVALFFPIERVSGVLRLIGENVAPESDDLNINYDWKGLFDLCLKPFTNLLLIPNEPLLQSIAGGAVDSCNTPYPVVCSNETQTFATCSTGIIACDVDTGNCPFFLKEESSVSKDQVSAGLAFVVALLAIFISTVMISKMNNKMLINNPVEVIAKLTTQNEYVIMFVGTGIGMLLADPSVSESSIMPLVATGIIEIEQMFPWCLGTNLGGAVTNLCVAWSFGNNAYLQVAIGNLCFNLFSTIIWYPLPYLRECPLHGSLIVGIMTRTWGIVSIVNFVVTFIAVPFTFYGIGNLMAHESKGKVGLGWFLFVVIAVITFYFTYSWFNFDGRERFIEFFEDPQDEDNKGGGVINDLFRADKGKYDDSFDDNTDDGSDISSIGFQEPRSSSRRKKSQKVFEVVRPKTLTPPKERKRLIKNYGAERDENCGGCCADACLS